MLILSLKALHIMSMVAWFAGLFYIFRLFVYHVQKKEKSDVVLTFRVMEEKLLRIIMFPAMLFTLATGILLIFLTPHWLTQAWMHIKLLFVFILLFYHWFCFYTYKRFLKNDYFLTERACRFWNELPTLVLVIAVIMVVLKPF